MKHCIVIGINCSSAHDSFMFCLLVQWHWLELSCSLYQCTTSVGSCM